MSELIPIVGIVFVIGLPMLGLVVRFAFRPLVRDIAEAIRASKGVTGPELDRRLTDLEDTQREISRHLGQLVEAERFRQRLESGAKEEVPDPAH